MQISIREIKIAQKFILQKHTFKIFPTIVTLESLRNQVWIFLELYVEDVFTYVFFPIKTYVCGVKFEET